MKKLSILFLALIAISCAGKKQNVEIPDKFHFIGDYQYFADAAIFRDCATGMNLPVAAVEEGIDAERTYNGMKGDNWNGFIFMECYGRVEMMPAAEEGKGNVPTLVIDSLVGFDHTVACNPESQLIGLYVGNTPKTKNTLFLRNDYTFWHKIYNNDNDKFTETEGTWGKLSEDKLIIISNDGKEKIGEVFVVDVNNFKTLTSSDSVKYLRENL